MRAPHTTLTMALLLAFSTTAGPAGAEYYSKYGFGSDDVARYKRVSTSIPSCSLAQSLNPFDFHHVDVQLARRLAGLYGRCHRDLKQRNEPIQIIRVNDVNLGMQCIAAGAGGGDHPAACDIPSALP